MPYKTPPYSTAKPDVISAPLRLDDGEQIKFVIMGSDGRESLGEAEDGHADP